MLGFLTLKFSTRHCWQRSKFIFVRASKQASNMRTDILFLVFLGLAGLMLVLALLSKIFPAKKPSSFYGYKSDRAVRSRRNWKYAQKLLPILFLRVAMYLIAGAVLWSFSPISGLTIGLILLGLILVGGITAEVYRSESKLKRYSREQN